MIWYHRKDTFAGLIISDKKVNLNINYPPTDLIRSDKRWDVNVEMRSSFALRQQVTRFESLTIHNEWAIWMIVIARHFEMLPYDLFCQASVCLLEQENCELERKVSRQSKDQQLVLLSQFSHWQLTDWTQVRLRTEEAMMVRRELAECQRMLQSSEELNLNILVHLIWSSFEW